MTLVFPEIGFRGADFNNFKPADLNSISYNNSTLRKNRIINRYGPWFIPAAWEVVRLLKKKKIPQVIVSNADSKSILADLEYLSENFFDDVFGVDNFPAKPNPAMIQYAMKRFCAKEDEVIFIGDSEIDKQAAKSAQVKFFEVQSIKDFANLSEMVL
jgi:HAD superfamily hydrolase (TIGR01549 family)